MWSREDAIRTISSKQISTRHVHNQHCAVAIWKLLTSYVRWITAVRSCSRVRSQKKFQKFPRLVCCVRSYCAEILELEYIFFTLLARCLVKAQHSAIERVDFKLSSFLRSYRLLISLFSIQERSGMAPEDYNRGGFKASKRCSRNCYVEKDASFSTASSKRMKSSTFSSDHMNRNHIRYLKSGWVKQYVFSAQKSGIFVCIRTQHSYPIPYEIRNDIRGSDFIKHRFTSAQYVTLMFTALIVLICNIMDSRNNLLASQSKQMLFHSTCRHKMHR